MKKPAGAERRQYPRVEESLPLKVAVNGYDFKTTTENISCLGAYCRINKYVPPFTRVMVRLSLPGGARKGADVECKGVIVRTEDEPRSGGFKIAIFFNAIQNIQRKKISDYLKRFLNPAPALQSA